MKVFRRVKQNLQWVLINVTGLSIAVACSLIILLYILQQTSYDRFHSKADYIYRITLESNQGASSIHPARVYGDLRQMVTDYPVIERMVRLVPFRNAIVKIGDQKFYSRNAFLTDSSFFKVFDFKVISGNSKKAFSQPGQVFISRTLAIKYFGTLDVIGKEISILHQHDPNFKVFTIDGVMEDFPANSHFHADLLSSFTSEDDLTTWSYTYFLIKKGTDINALRGTLQQKMESENKSGNPAPVIYLQKLTDIHLFSHKSREIENNGEIRSIVLLVSGTIIIIFIALINFFNLSRVQFISRLKSIKVKLINGASREILAGETALESLLLSALSILVGLVIAISLSRHLGISIFDPDRIVLVFLVVLGFIFTIALLSVLPLFTSKIVNDIKVTSRQENLYTYPLLIQFTLAVTAIAATIVLNRQMDYINRQHPASQNANMMVIPDNPWESIQRYEVFKNELLNSTLITAVTAAMEDPGSDILDAVDFEMEGIEKKEGQSINIFTTDSNFFSSLGIHPLAGTTELGFTPSQKWESDAVELSQLRENKSSDKQKLAELEKRVGGYREKYILNQSALKMLGIYNPGKAIGKRFRINFFLPDLFPEGEIVGVVPDFHYTNLHSEEKPLAIAPRKMFNYCFLISIDPKQRGKAIAKIASAWQKINPEFPLQYEFITDTYRKVYAGEYAQTRVLSLFALISIILSALGIFAMAAFSMQHRIKEIGIRKVNGAKVFEILALINKDFIKWIAIAFVIATPVAYFAMRKWLQNFAYKTELSWWIFAVAGLIALGIALLTVSWQSWKAATRNPVEALRYE